MNEAEIVRIPAERVKVLIGEKGTTRKLIEKKCRVSLSIDSEGEVEISGDATDIFFAKDVIKAIGRGFLPTDAIKLIDHDYVLHLIPLKEIFHTDKAITRLKGRVIGEKGKTRKEIEEATESILSIYGSTIGILGRLDSIEYAKEAVGMLLDGAPHSSVINYLARARRQIMEQRLRS